MQLLAAAGSSGSSSAGWLIFLIPVVLIGYMFYSQRRRSQTMRNAQSALNVGDQVSTTSGMFGQIVAFEDGVVHLEVSPGVVVRFAQRAVVPTSMVAGKASTQTATPPAADADPTEPPATPPSAASS